MSLKVVAFRAPYTKVGSVLFIKLGRVSWRSGNGGSGGPVVLGGTRGVSATMGEGIVVRAGGVSVA